MPLSSVVEQLLEASELTAEARVVAEALRGAAALADDPEATAASRLRAQSVLLEGLARWSEVGVGPELPRLGRLSGVPARRVLIALGYPVEGVDEVELFAFDVVEAVRLQHLRRKAGLAPQPGLQALIDYEKRSRT